MKSLKQAVTESVLFIALAFYSVSANFYVFGVVIDASDNAIADARIVISTAGSGGGDVLDTLYSGANGAFAKDIVYGEDIKRVRYRASKTGYNTLSGMGEVVRDTADLDTIVLGGESTSGVYVFGIVLNTAGNPVNEASVILSSGGGGGGGIIDTLFSDANGTFGENVVYSSMGMQRRIRYEASKSGYLPANGSGEVENDTCDLDTITLRDGVTSSNKVVEISVGKKPDTIQLFTLRGQMLYSGRNCDLDKALSGKITRSQILIVHFRLGNTVLYKNKIQLTQ